MSQGSRADQQRSASMIIVSTVSGKRYGKTLYREKPQGELKKGFDGKNTTKWRASRRFFYDLGNVRDLLETLETHSGSALLLGNLTPRGEELVSQGKPINRRKSGKDACVQDWANHIISLDIEREDKADDKPLQERIEAHIALLPECFHNASYVYQVSSSHGVEPGWLRIHLYFWVDKPITLKLLGEYLKRVASSGVKDLLDTSLDPTTALITSKPIYGKYVQEPVLSGPRVALITKSSDTVTLDPSAYTKPKPKKPKRDPKPRRLKVDVETDEVAQACFDRVISDAYMLTKGSKRNERIFAHS